MRKRKKWKKTKKEKNNKKENVNKQQWKKKKLNYFHLATQLYNTFLPIRQNQKTKQVVMIVVKITYTKSMCDSLTICTQPLYPLTLTKVQLPQGQLGKRSLSPYTTTFLLTKTYFGFVYGREIHASHYNLSVKKARARIETNFHDLDIMMDV